MTTKEEERHAASRRKVQESLFAIFKSSNGDWSLVFRTLREMRETTTSGNWLVLYEMYLALNTVLFGRVLKETDLLESDWDVFKP